MAHTLGPWSIEVDDQSGIGRTHAVYICDPSGWPDGQIARINIQDGLGEREANARLIAAAPDLLAALVRLVPADFAQHPSDFADDWHQAVAAIAKAKGEA